MTGTRPKTHMLPAKLNGQNAAELHSLLLGGAKTGIILNASEVEMLGAQCLQLLLAAVADTVAEQPGLQICNISDDMRRALGVFGVSPDQIGAQEELNVS